MSDKFDATNHLRQLRGKGGAADYLDVKWRLVWLRSEHPDAISSIEHVEIGPDQAIFRATVSIPGGGSATDYGSETPRDFGDYIEKAATKALGRALAQLGYGTQFVGFELDENTRIVDSPVERDDDDGGHATARATRPAKAPESAPQPRRDAEAPAPALVPPAPPRKVADWPDEELLAVVQDDNRDPVRRLSAANIYAARAADPLDLNARMIALAALPTADREKIRAGMLARFAPAGVAG